MSNRLCHACGAPWVSDARIPGRTETCERCGAYLHCCLNCQDYAPGAPNDCREPNVEKVHDKAGANFCDYFAFTTASRETASGEAGQGGRQAFDDLFKS